MTWRAALLLTLGLVVQAREPERCLIPSGVDGLRAQIWHQPPSGKRRHRIPVLILHGATFPTSCAAAWRMDGRSWMDDLSAAGFDTWALDFVGYGGSDRFPEMRKPAGSHPPLGRTEAMATQVKRAVDWIIRQRGVTKIFLVAHSAGTFAAGRYAAENSDNLERLVLFGAPGPRPYGGQEAPEPLGGHAQLSAEDQWGAWEEAVKAGPNPGFTRGAFDRWVRHYLATDHESAARQPPSVRVPRGMMADYERLRAGILPYEPGQIRVPTLLIRGAWDGVVGEEETEALLQRLVAAPLRQSVVVPKGGHRMHLEASRGVFYRKVRAFLSGGGQ